MGKAILAVVSLDVQQVTGALQVCAGRQRVCEAAVHTRVLFFKTLLEKLSLGELIVRKYVAESITMIAGCFGHKGLCQLRTNSLQTIQCSD